LQLEFFLQSGHAPQPYREANKYNSYNPSENHTGTLKGSKLLGAVTTFKNHTT
jgi:hypothetical protein